VVKNTIRFDDVLQHQCVYLYCLFFQVSYESVAELWVTEVCDEEGVHENSLKANDYGSFYQAGFSDFQEDN
jgi:hypothetical protein